jgi:tetratricopeptide (TPR) repeat protein
MGEQRLEEILSRRLVEVERLIAQHSDLTDRKSLQMQIDEIRNPHMHDEYYAQELQQFLTMRDNGKFDEAIAGFQKLITFSPQRWEGWHELGCAYYWKVMKTWDSMNESEREITAVKALQAYQVAQFLNPKNMWTLHDQGNVYLNILNRPDIAEKIYKESIQRWPRGSKNERTAAKWFYHDLGSALHRQGKIDEAIEQYHFAFTIPKDGERDKELCWTHHGLSSCYGKKGDIGNMCRHMQLAIELGLDKLKVLIDSTHSLLDYGNSIYRDKDESKKEEQIKVFRNLDQLFSEIEELGHSDHSTFHHHGDANLRLAWITNDKQYARKAITLYNQARKFWADYYWTNANLSAAYGIVGDEANRQKFVRLAKTSKK